MNQSINDFLLVDNKKAINQTRYCLRKRKIMFIVLFLFMLFFFWIVNQLSIVLHFFSIVDYVIDPCFCFISCLRRNKKDKRLHSDDRTKGREREREIFKICMDSLSFIAASYFFLRSLSIGPILLMMCIVGNLVRK